jgi:hypothetical protein
MVVKTVDLGAPAMNAARLDARADMFAQSNALYSRINKSSKTSPWMIVAPAVVVALVGGALIAGSAMHPAAQPKASPAPAPIAAAPAQPVQAAPADTAKAAPVKTAPPQSTRETSRVETSRTLKVETSPPKPVHVRTSRIPTSSDGSVGGPAPSAYDLPQKSAQTQPDTVTATPATTVQPAPTQPAPTLAAPTLAAPPPVASTPAPQPSAPASTSPSP